MRTSFRRLIIRLSVAGIIILVIFPLGVLAYLRTIDTPDQVAVKKFQASIEAASTHDITVMVGEKKYIIQKGEISGWVESYTRTYSRETDYRFTSALDDYLQSLADKSAVDPIDARFTIAENGTPSILVPARYGHRLNIGTAKTEFVQQLQNNSEVITLSTEDVEPVITEEKIRALGVSARIAGGESNFAGSTKARIQNIKVASKKYNGLIIKPHEKFSFNTILGDVDASTGYAPEKVIKGGQIQYEYGGGICQVSTTLFRAAYAAGFPILERKNHAFPVHYYEPQGFDATIYPGVSDMRFTNDTDGPILIQTHAVGTKLFFEIYGTSDGRQVTIDGPYQFDIQPDGAMKAVVSRLITYTDGTSKTDQINSNYKSPGLFPTQPNPYE